jgi:hypothetical protein
LTSLEKENNVFENCTNFLIPIFLTHLDKLPVDQINSFIKTHKKLVKGSFLIIDSYKKMTLEKIKSYKEFVNGNGILDLEVVISFGQGHPSTDILKKF